jgi:NADH-quinone oxidoreductase subunit M
VLAVSTVILAAAYLLWLYRRVMHGPLKDPDDQRLRDVNGQELAYLVPIVILIVFMGLFPGGILRKMDASVARYVDSLKNKPGVAMTSGVPSRPALEPSTVEKPER